MPVDRFFIDSNTLLYTLDQFELSKGQVAQSWLRILTQLDVGITNLQVLNEVAHVVIRKSERFGGLDPFARIDAFASFGSSPLTASAALAARDVHKAYHYSWWDCLLLAAALELGCTHFLSEDLQDGLRIEDGSGKGLTIVDPFAHSPAQILPSP